MTTVKLIQGSVKQLAERELSQLRPWFYEFDAKLFDKKIAKDAKKGSLDFLAKGALEDHKKGKSREL